MTTGTSQESLIQDDDNSEVTWQVFDSEPINNTMRRFLLQPSRNVRIAKFYPGLELAGKSYSVTSLRNHVNRYYTIAHCMNNEFEGEYDKITRFLTNRTKTKYI